MTRLPKAILLWALCMPLLMGYRSMGDQEPSSPPPNIILMIGDGMGLTQITAGMIANGNKLNLERVKHIGFIKTFSADNLITDSSAGATAFATGKKTNNGYVGMSPAQKPITTIMELAHDQKMGTGVVATNYIQHGTPAAFYAHNIDRNRYEEISLDLLTGSLNLAIGGGKRFLEKRKDGLNLTDSLTSHGYELFSSLNKAKKAYGDQIIVTVAKDHLPTMEEGRGNFLKKASIFAMDRLQQREAPFILMIEGSQIDFGGHANDKDYIIREVIDFDQAVGAALDFAEEEGNTLVIITADHETGGMSIEDGSLMDREVIADFTAARHTATLIPVFAFGPGAENFMGIYDNTDIFYKMVEALNLGSTTPGR